MKVVKYILGVFFILGGISALVQGAFGAGLLTAILGALFLPPVSDALKEKFKFWQNKAVRYVSYIVLFGIVGVFMPKDVTTKSSSSKEDITENIEQEKSNKPRIINLDKVTLDSNMKKITPTENDITYRVVEVLKHNKQEGRIRNANSEQIVLLVEVSNYDEDVIKQIAFKLKDEYAKFAPKNCMIELWDDKKAYELLLERDKYISESFDDLMEKFQRTGKPIGDEHEKLKRKWDEKNYAFIADHNPATIAEGRIFWYYMLQDDYYKEVGGKNYKK